MIARLWSARTTAQLSPAYLEYFSKNVLPELQAIPGYVSANVLTTANANEVEILVQTVWQSLDAITGAYANKDFVRGGDRKMADPMRAARYRARAG